MNEIMNSFIENLTNLVSENGILVSLVFSSLIIILESILPFLPLAVFIGLNMIVFGTFVGFLISWAATIIGCMVSFTLFREFLSSKIKKESKVHKVTDFIDKVSFSNLVMVLAFPFTPAFLINIGAGLSKISYKKYFISLCVGKISLVYFWGFVGQSAISSLKDPIVLLKLILMIMVAYIISKLINKKFNIGG